MGLLRDRQIVQQYISFVGAMRIYILVDVPGKPEGLMLRDSPSSHSLILVDNGELLSYLGLTDKQMLSQLTYSVKALE